MKQSYTRRRCTRRGIAGRSRQHAHSGARRVEDRLVLQPRRAALADDLDLEAGGARLGQLGRDVSPRQRDAGVVGVATAGDPADDLVAVGAGCQIGSSPITSAGDASVGLDDEHHQLALRTTGGDLGFDRVAPDEVVIELQHPVHSRLERCVDRPVLAEPRAEVLLEPHRDERAEPEQPHVELAAGLPQQVEQVSLVLGLHPDLVAEVARVRHPRQPHRCHAEVDLAERHEREVGGWPTTCW